MVKKHLKPMAPDEFQRKVGTRNERISARDPQKLVFSLKYFDPGQPKKDKQSYNSWEKDERLADFMDTIEMLCDCSLLQAMQQGLIKKYHSFPPPEKTDFKCPQKFKNKPWCVIKKITGQKARVAGVMVGNIFYIVFFDKDHRFWISEKKFT